MSTAISGRIALLRFSTSTPDMSERERSTSATSKGDARTWAMASSPVRASPATSMSTRPEETCFSLIRTTSWALSIRRRIIVLLSAGVFHPPITAWQAGRGPVGKNGFACRTGPTLCDLLEGVTQDNLVPLHGDVFPLEPGQIRHELPRGLVDDVAGVHVIAQRAVRVARRAALIAAKIARHQVQDGLVRRGNDEGRVVVLRRGRHDRGLRLQLQRRAGLDGRDVWGDKESDNHRKNEDLHGSDAAPASRPGMPAARGTRCPFPISPDVGAIPHCLRGG